MMRRIHGNTIMQAATIALAAAFAALALGACSGDSTGNTGGGGGDTTKVETQLHFLAPEAGTPPLSATVVAMWAVRGETREVRLSQKNPGAADSSEFLRFKVDDDALVALPNGTPIPQGDSVLITLTVVDAARFIVNFEPSGLTFRSDKPAELRLRYAYAGADLNDDGRRDSEDDDIEDRLSIWKQELPGDPWVRIGSARIKDNNELRADIRGFTRYAIAY